MGSIYQSKSRPYQIVVTMIRYAPSPKWVIYAILWTAFAASGIVRQWGEAARFDEFGIRSQYILLGPADTLIASVDAAIGRRDFIGAVHASAGPTRPWGITLKGTDGTGHPVTLTFLSAVTDSVLPFDEEVFTPVIIVRQTVGIHTSTSVIRRKKGIFKSFPTAQSMAVERHGKVWTVTMKADNGNPDSYTLSITMPDIRIESFGISVPAKVRSRQGGFRKTSDKVEVHRASLQYAPLPPMASLTSVNALTSHFLHSTDPLEGYYSIYERAFEEQYLRPGGDYVFAFVRTPDGGYDIIYISGATHSPSDWHTGMVRGHASPTANPMQYGLTWIDARFQPVASEGMMTIDAEGLVSLQFPYLSSSVRLQRAHPHSVHP